MTLKQHVQISRRSIGLLAQLSRRHLVSLALNSVLYALLPYVPIYFSARLIDALAHGQSGAVLTLYAALTVGLAAVLNLAVGYLNAQEEIGFRETYAAHAWRYGEKAMSLSYASIEDRSVALLRERIKMENQTGYGLFYLQRCLRNILTYGVQIIASLSLTASFFAAKSVALPGKMAFLAGVAVTIAAIVATNRKSEQLKNRLFASYVDGNVLLEKYNRYLDHYTSGKDIRLYAMEAPLSGLAADLYHTYWMRERHTNLRCAGLELISTLMNYALRLGIYLLLVSSALSGGISVGSIAQDVSSVMLLLTAVSGLVSAVQLSLVNHVYTQRYFSYFDLPNPMYQGSLSVEKREDNQYEIEFRNVSFRYPGAESDALRSVSMKFNIGERLAVVGKNGSGKTTFIKLLCRLYDPTEGEILLNGVDIRKYDYHQYLALFSVVFQDFRLFSFSLGQNVAASAAFDPRKVAACLKEAGFAPRADTLPQGLNTALYQDFDSQGVEISGGEAQKIALARALYKGAPFMVLDEPTSALDPVSEYQVYRSFSEISGGKTALYISHRLASCRFCDEILVFDQGRIVQRGNHSALLAEKGGKYATLWNAQAQYYTPGKTE